MVQSSNSPESQPDASQFEFPAGQQQAAEQAPSRPEQAPAHSPEELPGQEQKTEQEIEAADRDDQVVLPQVADDTTSDDNDGTSTTTTSDQKTASSSTSSMPAIADDVDVIEKAWVNKAKQIIQETKDDPYAQEEEFEKLQIEYHKKRYGRDIKATR